jgi:hypothetical protein
MALTPYSQSTNIIGSLGTDPEDRTDLDDQGLKDKFDQNAVNIVAYLNDTHLPEVQAELGAVQTGITEAQAGLATKDNALISFVDDTASRTLALTDANKKLRASHASVAINYTVPPDSSVAFPIGTYIIIEMTGAAQVAVVAGSGVTINLATKLKVNGQGTSAVLLKEAENTWSFQGSVKA